MTRKSKRIVTLVIGVALVAVWAVLCIRTNLMYPPIPREDYGKNETFTIETIEYTPLASEVVSGEETKEILRNADYFAYREIVENYDCKRIRMCLVTMRVKNTGDQTVENAFNNISQAMMITPYESLSGMYRDIAQARNAAVYGEEWHILEAGEENTWTLTYFLDSSWMSATQWEHVESIPFEFIVDDYPVEIRFSAYD